MNARQILRRRGAVAAVTSVLVAGGIAGCTSGHRITASTTVTTARSDGPSDAAHIVCTDTARNEITGALGIDTTKPLAPTWSDHTYSCRYVFTDGSLLLSVKDLPDAAATTAWFDSLRTAAGSTPLSGMGDGAIQQPDGNVVVRKDDAVLVVDVTALPASVGKPVRPRAVAARTVAQTVMICWKEYG